ncbi:nitronate monooxygenase [Paracoccus caeni]|uniref:Propionate 3-nitronate monooxygenase n=1 Tax=Paracoccus caeni TaxID=657651 RepID=A0A934VZ47_9RHOB|nr:nitronate monooxygenase [Paracoccus caeni]MBK4214469.1 nitronate monooxygenase [Paracoccus caeni]
MTMFDRLKHRVVQAPMAGVSTPALAAAVAEAGGFGFVALGAIDAGAAREQIAATRQQTSQPIGVNLFCHRPQARNPELEAKWLAKLAPDFARFDAEPPKALRDIYPSFVENDAMLAALVELQPAVVSFHFGLPRADQISALRDAGAMLWATATSVEEAQAIKDAGIDVLVAQGWQAGGHRGMFDPDAPDERLETLALVRALKPLGLPVVAAGAIMDRNDARAAIEAGAVAVQCGSAFLLSPEAGTTQPHRKAMSEQQTVMTKAISGRPARGLSNLFTRIDDSGTPGYPHTYDAGKALIAAAKAKGETGYGAYWAGTEAARAVARPAAETVAAISP